nr:hypothetical protein [uncultured Allomuricauda sp.]
MNWKANSNREKFFVIDCDGELCGLAGLIFQKDVYRKSVES